ncbi:hypothetical protein A3Q34_16750 [Colwellia sp. PAMC 20917]|uniref:HvfA family oxazolone/thioamide-modified RiPP metallophore n=1 Tax=Colwellia sp. PAMC 20917 TaxID=1816218 RepID=UPI0008780610|nr:hypothetical protein [Colwellia sp. PAMC 20917]AOW78342.1 hypothetical protein A3Q34_16750 [Colwellia sp. PAMC 20917]
MKILKKSSLTALLGLFALTLAISAPVKAEINPFETKSIVTITTADASGKCGEGKADEKAKCGEGKADKKGKCGEGKCGEGKADKKGKCGEGKCGEGKADKKGKCGETKTDAKKCGG